MSKSSSSEDSSSSPGFLALGESSLGGVGTSSGSSMTSGVGSDGNLSCSPSLSDSEEETSYLSLNLDYTSKH